MGNRIYVKNISFSTKKKELRDLFENTGKVLNIEILKDKRTGKNIGSAIIEMRNDFEAFSAIDRYDEFRLNGRFIRVIPAHDKYFS